MKFSFTLCCWLLCVQLIAQTLPSVFHIDTTDLTKNDLVSYLEKIDSLEGTLPSEQRKQVISFGYRMSKKLQLDSLVAVFGTRLGGVNIFGNNPHSAQAYALESMKILEENYPENYRLIAQNAIILGLHAQFVEYDYKSVIDYYEISKANYLKLPSLNTGLLDVVANLSVMYADIGEYKKAISLLKDNISIANQHLKGSQKYFQLVNNYHKIGFYHFEDGKIDSARIYYNYTKGFIPEVDTIQKSSYYNMLIWVYADLVDFETKYGEFSEAKKYYEKSQALKKFKEITFMYIEAIYTLRSGQLEKAKKAFAFLEKNEGGEHKDNIAGEYYEKIGNYKQANEANKEKLKRNKKALKDKNLRYSALANARYESEKKEKEIALLKIEEQKLASQNQMILIGSICLFSLLILIGLLLRQTKRKNKILDQELKSQKIIVEQVEEIKINAQRKERFIVNVAHELRTPLTLIRAPIEMMKSSDLEVTKNREHLNLIERGYNKLQKRIESILQLSKMDEVKIEVEVKKISVKELMAHLNDIFLLQAQSKGVKLIFQNSLSDEAELITDPYILIEIFENLLGNALKHTFNEGEISIDVKEQEESIIFRIKDNGTGISEEDISHIFERYFQSKDPNKSKIGGTGIGLALVKNYVNLLNSSIEVKSNLGKGTTFILQIPKIHQSTDDVETYKFSEDFTRTLGSEIQKTSNTLENAPLLLIVEDDLDISESLRILLEKDYNLAFAHNGKEGLEKYQSLQPDLVITDLMMPLMNGEEMAMEIRSKESDGIVPILMLTALVDSKIRRSALLKGLEDYLTKPFEGKTLIAHIENLLRWADVRKEAKEKRLAKIDSSGERYIRKLEWIKELEKFIFPKLSNFNLNLDDICEGMNISKSKLIRKTKSIIGMTPKEYIQELRFIEARRMILTKEVDSVKAASYSVGFKQTKNFSKNFKRRFGKYPSELL